MNLAASRTKVKGNDLVAGETGDPEEAAGGVKAEPAAAEEMDASPPGGDAPEGDPSAAASCLGGGFCMLS